MLMVFIFFKLKGLLYPKDELNILHYIKTVNIRLGPIIQYFIGYIFDIKEGYLNIFPLLGLIIVSITHNFNSERKLILIAFFIVMPNLFLISFANYMYAGLYSGGRFLIHSKFYIFYQQYILK